MDKERIRLCEKVTGNVRHIALLLYIQAHDNLLPLNLDNIKMLRQMLKEDGCIVLAELVKLDFIQIGPAKDEDSMEIKMTMQGEVFIKRIINICENNG